MHLYWWRPQPLHFFAFHVKMEHPLSQYRPSEVGQEGGPAALRLPGVVVTMSRPARAGRRLAGASPTTLSARSVADDAVALASEDGHC